MAARLRVRLDAREGVATRTHEAVRKSIARSITAENYNGVESLGETRRSTALRSAKPTGLDNPIDPTAPHPNTILRRVVMKLEDNVFNDLPLLLAVPRAAQLLGISRAAAYRLAASGDLPVRRLGGRVYVVTAGLRELAS
jgi:hypothetical protein